VNTALNTDTSVLTSSFDVVRGLVAGDKINLNTMGNGVATANLVFAATNLAGANVVHGGAQDVSFAAGTYNAASGIFTFAANGTDTLMTYGDVAGAATAAFESVVLVGFHITTAATAAAGVITLG
jgi:hypothetical protein